MFELIGESLKSAVNKLKFVDDEKALKNALDTLKKALLKADVHHKVTKELVNLVESDLKKTSIGQKQFLDSIKSNLTSILTAPNDGNKGSGFVYASNPPTVVLMAGLQGGGKTTTTVKLANYLKVRKKKVLIAACDLQRLAAVEQLRQLCTANELELFYMENENDPIKVAKNALQKAKNELYDVLLVDTAGRLAIDETLMSQIKDIKSTINPHEIFYVADAMSGQDGVKTAASFNEALGITGVILSKFDADTKGGVAIGIAKQINIPLRFVGVGEKPADLESFIPDRIVGRIMGEGDLATLAEKTSTIIDEKEAKRLNKKIKKGEFNFNDFLAQLESVKKLGSMKSLIGMIPGLGNMANQIKDIDLDNSKEIKHIKAMIDSMTPKERENPDLLNNARKRRIAAGAGIGQIEVNKFLKQFSNAAKLAKRFSNKDSMKGFASMMANSNRPR
ncbi:signal recognition particle protein [Campylobacter fetus]|mgnify:CR=1 FL=1|uniref:signal-recognition-particle GTPase n=3 Tax=Campylobacter fetus TaxID=196 RepID=A0A5L4LG73_CAMFE|nr:MULTISPECIES: signal recognition particle protein [Campylobacter]OCS22137.1 signal recognition particle [Campylobacter fetus subsp. venerealis cfvi97/532]OCS26721.1 signal recognition particle [Campylobacter fetus subsp. venerealis cfvB10]OCS30553.1 signal recognition particle [Campylobacter fetus subsp. venerealis LMG 6570 = CCUG 33900]OCS43070.1 signal recognition particle [Campylobacter fetus subsp. venerealis cfvi02/298]ABK81871.1 signal recognition particle protein [Campylobacter fetus